MGRKVYKLLDIKLPNPKQFLDKPIGDVMYLNKKNVFLKTTRKMTKKRLEKFTLPLGMKIFHIPQVFDTEAILHKMFEKFIKTKYSIIYAENTTIFQTETPQEALRTKTYTVQEVLEIIKGNHDMERLINYYFDEILQKLNAINEKQELLHNTTLSILRYKDKNNELHCHLDNLSQGKGPIITVNIGPKIFYDMIPVYFTNEEKKELSPLRIRVKSDEVVILDGLARYCWAHCIPYGFPKTEEKFTIKFVFPQFREKKNIYNIFFGQKINFVV